MILFTTNIISVNQVHGSGKACAWLKLWLVQFPDISRTYLHYFQGWSSQRKWLKWFVGAKLQNECFFSAKEKKTWKVWIMKACHLSRRAISAIRNFAGKVNEKWDEGQDKKNLKRVHAKPWRQRKWGKMNKKVWHWLLSNQVIIVVICLDNTYTAFSNCRTISYITANSCTCPKKSWKLPTSWTSWGFLGDE